MTRGDRKRYNRSGGRGKKRKKKTDIRVRKKLLVIMVKRYKKKGKKDCQLVGGGVRGCGSAVTSIRRNTIMLISQELL